ncbi:MAG: thioesterase family protein [Bacteroidia bacterium]|jgi:acyl-CoA thioester hydrolase
MIRFQTTIRVRYGETDKMGVVYNGNYALYFEVGRTEALRELGLTYDNIEANGVMMPVHSMNAVFKRPAYYDDLLTITSMFKELPTSRTQIFYEITNAAGQLICTGDTTLVFIDSATNKPVRCPAFISEVFQPLFEG